MGFHAIRCTLYAFRIFAVPDSRPRERNKRCNFKGLDAISLVSTGLLRKRLPALGARDAGIDCEVSWAELQDCL